MPHNGIKRMCEQAKSLQDVIDYIPDAVDEKPDIEENNNAKD